MLRSAVDRAKLGQDDTLFALRKLDAELRRLERVVNGPAFDDFISDEFVRSHEYGGRSVFGWELPSAGRRERPRRPAKVKTPITSSVGGGQPPTR